MTTVTQRTTTEQPTRRPLDRGIASLAAVCDGLFDGRTRRRAPLLAFVSRKLNPETPIGNRKAA